jgi:hypothetical protein
VWDYADRPVRRFQAYNVGIAKTGSTSIAGLFGHYRSAHEFMFEQTARTLVGHARGEIAHDDLRAFIRQRDERGLLEMDAATFSFSYADILVQEFPAALFLLTIRDCYSWLDSLLNMTLLLGPRMPAWMVAYGQHVNRFRFVPAMAQSRATFIQHLPELVEASVRYWARANRHLLEVLPPERTLLLHTTDISTSIDTIAAFIGVPAHTLLPAQSHLFRAAKKLGLLHEIDYEFLRKQCERHCGALMGEFFPSDTLRGFLQANPQGIA